MTTSMSNMSRSRGFTLIEVMIAVVIVGILASIAYPSYREHIKRGHETEAKGQMMEAAAALEAHRAKNFTYGGTLASLAPTLDANDNYTAVLSIGGSNLSYTITATPSSSLMSGMPTLTLNNEGEASWDTP